MAIFLDQIRQMDQTRKFGEQTSRILVSYMVKEIFGDPRNFGGSDPANMFICFKFEVEKFKI